MRRRCVGMGLSAGPIGLLVLRARGCLTPFECFVEAVELRKKELLLPLSWEPAYGHVSSSTAAEPDGCGGCAAACRSEQS